MAFVSPMKRQLLDNMAGWQKDRKDYRKCPKCKGYGVSITLRKRDHTQCSQCNGTGWKYKAV